MSVLTTNIFCINFSENKTHQPYIDKIFQQYNITSLESFWRVEPNFKYIRQYSEHEINFLDLKVCKTANEENWEPKPP